MGDGDGTSIETRPPERLAPHPLNDEVYGDRSDLDETFLESVADHGVIEPVVIDPTTDDEDGTATIISGHRRVAAAKRVGLDEVPVRIQRFDSDLARRERLIVHNKSREKTFSQKMREAEALEEIERKRAKQRQGTRTDTSCSAEQDVDAGTAREKVAEEVGFGSGTTYHRARTVWEAREADDETVATAAKEQVEQLNAAEQSISGAYSAIKNEQQRTERKNESTDDETSHVPTLDSDDTAPAFLQADAASLPLADETVDVIVTSPPYNLGHEEWSMGWRATREEGIGYFDDRPEDEYQAWQRRILAECHRVARDGASLFYVHKVRIKNGEVIHPIEWLQSDDNPWHVRQAIVWNRQSTHNHEPTLFRPQDARIYWMTKGTPAVPDDGIDLASVWDVYGPRPNTSHPAPFPEEIPTRCLEAVATEGDVVLDPMGGSMNTCHAATELGYRSIGIDVQREYILDALRQNQ